MKDSQIKWSAVRREINDLHAQLMETQRELAKAKRRATRCVSCLRSVSFVQRMEQGVGQG